MPTRIRTSCRHCKNYFKNKPERFMQVLLGYKAKCTAAQDLYGETPCPKFEKQKY
jgi:hypothetical protein